MFFLSRLAAEVDALQATDFPVNHAGPKKWLAVIEGFITTAQGYLVKSFASDLPPDSASKLLKDAELAGKQAYDMLQRMEGTDSAYIPHQIIAPFEDWATALGIENTLFFRAEHAPNYEVRWFPKEANGHRLNGQSKELVKALQTASWPVMRITVPSHAMGMLPHFAVVGHELGHCIAEPIKNAIDEVGIDYSEVCNKISTRLETHGLTLGEAEFSAFSIVLFDWIEELVADAIGLYIAGPAFYFALFGFLEMAPNGIGLATSHPPSSLRREILATRLKAGPKSFFQCLGEKLGFKIEDSINSPNLTICPSVDALFELLTNRDNGWDVPTAAICAELVDFVPTLVDKIHSAAKTHLLSLAPQLIYDVEQFEADLDNHLSEVYLLIPPIERQVNGIAESAGLATILNVGWAALLGGLEDFPPPDKNDLDAQAQKMERLHSLLLKALELSEARTVWMENREKQPQ